MNRSPIAVALAALVVVGIGCTPQRDERQAAQAAPPAPPTLTAPAPLPAAAADGAIGGAGASRVLGAADDGAWVLLCQGEGAAARPHLVLGAGPGLPFDRVLVAAPRDLVLTEAGALIHVDVTARTRRSLGPIAPVSIDAASRRIVVARAAQLQILDPGVAPRTLPAGGAVASVWLRTRRWAELEAGTPPADLTDAGCDPPTQVGYGARTTVDLDPSGVEAADRIGPELGITASGEVTLDGEVVIGADCVARVVAALATPPRVLAMCNRGRNIVAGPGGFRREVDGSMGTAQREQATIEEYLVLGQRMRCISGACIDLLTGADYETYRNEAVWSDARTLVRKRDGGLLIDQLPEDPAAAGTQLSVTLPRVTQAVSVDTVTGRRRAGAAPPPAALIDAAGRWLLYGRYVVDLRDGVLVATLGDDALAIDDAGRVLIGASPGVGPLRWIKP